ncbi:MAG TPA: hypothetical protein VFG50_04515, partial [Rhodothermales bacterium]|nr:hypothetical protein [Rhodothermales bacterium]
MEGKQMLQQLGVEESTLSPDEKAFLDEQGYLPLYDVLTPERTDALAARVDAIAEEEKEQAGRELMESKSIRHPKEHGALRLSDLVNKDPIFEVCYTHPRVLA